MKNKALDICMCRPKYAIIFLFLTLSVLVCLLYMNQLEIAIPTAVTAVYPVPLRHPANASDPCYGNQPRTSEEIVEELLLLDSIAWPETPVLPVPIDLTLTSSAAHSMYTVLPAGDGRKFRVGDHLEARILMRDVQGNPKSFGGDVLIARLHDRVLNTGVAGQVVDHLNGSYTAVFPLLWEGPAQVQVILEHPSEAISVLRRMTRDYPLRVFFQSIFHSGSIYETTVCGNCLPSNKPQCNYTDLHTGEPWFCYKPTKLSCDTRVSHYKGSINNIPHYLRPTEEKLFQGNINLKVFLPASGNHSVTVLPKEEGQPAMESSILKPEPSGYYYQGLWRAVGGATVHRFNDPVAISQCLTGKVVHMYGDSTVRQWFEYLDAKLPDLKQFNLHSSKQSGPLMAVDIARNIMVKWQLHGVPVRSVNVPVNDLRYIANELDGLVGGSHTVVVFGIWAHFSSFPIEAYLRRLQVIRRAVRRLLVRAPDTTVIIRTGNPMGYSLTGVLVSSDWYVLQRDKVLRAVFKGMNVHLVDAWEMVLAHSSPHNLHPPPPIIKNMVDIILSHICPQSNGSA